MRMGGTCCAAASGGSELWGGVKGGMHGVMCKVRCAEVCVV